MSQFLNMQGENTTSVQFSKRAKPLRAGFCVLVVDNDVKCLTIISRMLRSFDYEGNNSASFSLWAYIFIQLLDLYISVGFFIDFLPFAIRFNCGPNIFST